MSDDADLERGHEVYSSRCRRKHSAAPVDVTLGYVHNAGAYPDAIGLSPLTHREGLSSFKPRKREYKPSQEVRVVRARKTVTVLVLSCASLM